MKIDIFNIYKRLNTHKALQIFNIGRFASSMLTGVLLVNFGLPLFQFDNYELFFYYGSLVSFFWIAGFQQSFLSFYSKLNPDKKTIFGSTFFLFIFLLSLLAAFVLYLVANYIGDMATFKSDGKSLLPLMIIYTAINTPSYFIHLLFLLEEKPKQIVQFGILNFSLQLLLLTVPVAFGYSLFNSFLLLVCFAFLRLFYGFFLFLKDFKWKFELKELLTIVSISVPLILHALIGNTAEYVDGYLVEKYFTTDGMFAIFRYGAKELPFVTLIIASLVTSMIPVVTKNKEHGLIELKRKTKKFSHFFFPISILLLFLSNPLFTFFYGKEFSLSAQIFNVYILIVCSRILLPQLILIVRKERYFLIISAIFETIFNVSMSLIFLKEHGIIGIAYATVIANFLNKFMMISFNYLKLGIKPSLYIPIKTIVFYTIILIVVFVIQNQFYFYE